MPLDLRKELEPIQHGFLISRQGPKPMVIEPVAHWDPLESFNNDPAQALLQILT